MFGRICPEMLMRAARRYATSAGVRPESALYRKLDTDGDGGGTSNMARVADSYFLAPTSGQVCFMHRTLIYYSDTSNWDDDKWANFAAPLSSGILIQVRDSATPTPNVILDLLDGEPIKANSDWARECFDSKALTAGVGVELDAMSVRWTQRRDLGLPLVIDGSRGHRFVVEIQDDLSAMAGKMFVGVRGNIVSVVGAYL